MQRASLTLRVSVVERLLPRNECGIRYCGVGPLSHTAPLDLRTLPARGHAIVYGVLPVLSPRRGVLLRSRLLNVMPFSDITE